MKRGMISNYYFVTGIGTLIFGVGCSALIGYGFVGTNYLWFLGLYLLGSLYVLVMGVYLVFFSFFSGRYCMDGDGISLRIGFRTFHMPWNEIIDCDIIPVQLQAGIALYFICFSRHIFTYEDKRRLLPLYKKHVDEVAFIQYSKERVDAAIDLLPEHLAEKLRSADSVTNMSFIEKNLYLHRK